MRVLSAAVLLSLFSSLSHAGTFTQDVDIASNNSTTFGVGEGATSGRSFTAVSKIDVSSFVDGLKDKIGKEVSDNLANIGSSKVSGSWGGDCGTDSGSVSVPEPSSALLMFPAVLYLALRRVTGKQRTEK